MFHATTIVAVKKNHLSAMGGDGQVTMGQQTVIKHGAVKVRKSIMTKYWWALPVRWQMPLLFRINLKQSWNFTAEI